MVPLSSHKGILLTLKKAAERLNVHPSTLRRWANNGNVVFVLTPGGHRRFPEAEIERLAQTHQQADSQGEDLVERALIHTRAEMKGPQHPVWLTDMGEQERVHMRALGKRLMGLMMQYIAVDNGHDILGEVKHIGRIYAERARQEGLSITDALNATMFFRDNIVESAILLPDTVQSRPGDNQRLLRRINTFLNTIQLAIASAYEAGSSAQIYPEPGKKIEG